MKGLRPIYGGGIMFHRVLCPKREYNRMAEKYKPRVMLGLTEKFEREKVEILKALTTFLTDHNSRDSLSHPSRT